MSLGKKPFLGSLIREQIRNNDKGPTVYESSELQKETKFLVVLPDVQAGSEQ